MCPKDVNETAISVDPDQTAPLVWSVSPLFAQAYLSENLGSLRHCDILKVHLWNVKMIHHIRLKRYTKYGLPDFDIPTMLKL